MSIHNLLSFLKVYSLSIFCCSKNQLVVVFTCAVVLFCACQSSANQEPIAAPSVPVTERPTNTTLEDVVISNAPKPSSNLQHDFQFKVRPSNMEEGQKVPLLLVLHGYKSNMKDLFALKDYLDPRLTIVSLQAPTPAGKDKYKWFDLIFSNQGNVTGNPTEAEESRLLVSHFVDAAVNQFNANPQQVYLLGFSQGAMMSLYLTLSEPTKFAGAAILSGKAIEGLEDHISDNKKALSDLSILVTHGKKDQVISIDHAKEVERILSDLSMSLSYKEYPMGHQISEQCLKDIIVWFENEINSNLSSSVSE